MARIIITGGTGMIGKRLSQMLIDRGDEVIILTRNKEKITESTKGMQYANWDIEKGVIDKDAIAKADYIIHLAGAGVADKRWTPLRMKEIVESRTISSAVLVKAIKETPNNIKAIVSASAIGWYGADNPNSVQNGFDEDDKVDDAFLGNTCKLWEKSIEPVSGLGKRLVKLRIGIVLANEGGALAEFVKPIKMGVAAILGSGKQVISWIHIEDLCRMFIYSMDNENMQGAYNAVAPNPETNQRLTITLAKIIKGSFYISIHVPSVLLKIILGGMSIEVLKSATVSCKKILSAGYNFKFDALDKALKDLIKQ